MTNNLKVSFYLKREGKSKKSVSNTDAIYPIVGKIIVGTSIAQFSSKLSIPERLWNVKSGRAIGKSRIAVELNREINIINLSIHSHYKDILERLGRVTAIDVKNAFQGIATTQKTLLVLFREMMQEFQLRIGIDRKKSTYQNLKTAYRNLKYFLKGKYNVEDIPLNQLYLPFIEAYDFHLRVERQMTSGSALISIIYLQKTVRIALHQNLISYPPFAGYRPEKPELKSRSLSKDEFERIISTPLPTTKLCYIRDLFVFSSWTGLSFIDLKQLTWKNIITEEDGSLWISMSRQKTNISFNVKLLNVSVQIIDKYKGLDGITKNDLVFKVPSSSTMNYNLKTIAKHCNISNHVSFHTARHCFASQLCLSQGIPIESVSRMMGHRNIETTQRYARVNNEKIGKDMKALSNRLSGKFIYRINNQ
ncbi:site-specific integrase [Dysgonomonas capnocytophagoides]|uniref:Site-specific integrase n=1 Tax=Dysgonomonas capnocytophagoides TaxID=45254 RepID=A0A4Y8L2Z4_9BACT|nr:site-specific integrase [Dysgonomonas capnocytophagoides]TFD96428.1 site-specific integrase [Dysgonomonas capnocytophagoides]